MSQVPTIVEKPAPRRRRRLWIKLFGSTIVLVLIVLVGSWIWISRSVGNRLAQAIAEANRDDPNWQIDDFMAHREVVPDSENSALVLSRALETLPEDWPSLPRGPKGRVTHVPGSEVHDAFGVLSDAADNVRLDDKDVETLRAELKKYSEQVRLARTLADLKRGRHELTIGPTLIDTLLPQTQRVRNAARLLRTDAAILAHDGELDAAIDSARAILGVGRSIGDEPFIISQLVRINMGAFANSTVRRVLAHGEPSDAALARLQADLENELKQPLMLRSMRGERATLTELIRRIGNGEVPISALSGSNPAMTHDPSQPRRKIAPWGKLSLDNQRAIAIEWLNRAVEIAKRPSPERSALLAEYDAEIARVKSSTFGIYTATLPLLLIPAVRAVFDAQTRYEGELGATILLIAAERQRRKTGQWPAAASAIDRSILPDPPLDPVTGKAFGWKVGEGKIVIHSIGRNLKDENGLYEPEKWATGGGDDVGATGWDVDRRNQSSR